MSGFVFYWAGAAFVATWVISSRREDGQNEVSVIVEFCAVLLWPFFLAVLTICFAWLLLTGRLPWQR